VTDVRRDFRRSRRFGIVGVVVVAVASAAFALAFGQNGASPQLVLIPVLALVFGFVAVLIYLQRRDLDAAAARSEREAVLAAEPVTDPTRADQMSLLADLATGPVDREAIAAASGRVWDIARGSISAGAKMMVLIFCAVVPWQLFQWIWSIVVFVPLIIAYAVYLGARAIMPGGTLDRAYDDAAPTMSALGLSETERPHVEIHHQATGPQPLRHETVGDAAYAGTRRGRRVSVVIGGGSTVSVGGAASPFEIRAKGERLRAAPGAPPAVEAVIAPLRASSYWRGVSFTGGPDGVVAKRRSGGGEHWMRDLWVAEHLAVAADDAH
jgi:hypothetical protein